MKANTLPNEENLKQSTKNKDIYYYYDNGNKPVFKTKEIFKKEKRVIFYPYSINNIDQSIKPKRIQQLEFVDWSIDEIPDDFKTDGKYGIRKMRAKSFFSLLYSRFRGVTVFRIGPNIQNKFSPNTVHLNWSDLKQILTRIQKEKMSFNREKVTLINKELSKINNSIIPLPRRLPAGELSRYLIKFDSFEKVTSQDLSALSEILDLVPPSVIERTSNFLKSKDKINEVYIEEIIEKYETLLSSVKDNEKQWQSFFEKNAWVLSHLFPYEVVLKEREAYVGGKTIGNDDGRLVDFLFANAFTDNFALIEVKTHKKALLRNIPYRKPSAYSMSDDLSGGLAQCLDQKDTYIKEFGNKHPTFDPKCILVIGRKDALDSSQKSCFELLRANQKSVDIVTFDELLKKLYGLLKVISYNGNK